MAGLTAHALNVGFTPVITPGVAALRRHRISHVDQNYLRAETYAAANAPLITARADIALAQAWGGGLLAAVDDPTTQQLVAEACTSTEQLVHHLMLLERQAQRGEKSAARRR